MSQKKLQKGLEWLNKEVKKDEVDLSKERERFIQEIKNIKMQSNFKPIDLQIFYNLNPLRLLHPI